MAYLSSATDGWVHTTHKRTDHYASKTRDKERSERERLNEENAKKLGIKLLGQFDSKIRCLEMFDGRRTLNDLRVWTAEQDGSLSIRKATTGQATCTMDRKKDVFVSALLYHDQCMYAGLTDGYIRVYREIPEAVKTVDLSKEGAKLGATFKKGTLIISDVKIGGAADRAGLAADMLVTSVQGSVVNTPEEFKEALAAATEKRGKVKIAVRQVNAAGEPDYYYDEVRKHTGAVTCLEVVTGAEGDYKIFSGGNDWQIYVWAWDAGKTVFLSNMTFPGHQNAVRCLHFHPYDELTKTGGFLYSGGDDCLIRCLDIAGGEVEKAAQDGFPIETLGCVRALAAYKNNLFSATNEGLVQVWDASKGTLTATLFPFPKMRHFSSATHAQLTLNVVNNKIWSGGADGVIRVWRADGPLPNSTEWLETELQEHRGHFVTNLTSAQGAADGHVAWCTTEDGKIKLMYTESDAAEPESDRTGQGFTEQERELVQTIDDKRQQMIANSDELRRRTELHEKIKSRDAKRKAMIVDIYCKGGEQLTRRRFYLKLMAWYAKQRNERMKENAAALLETGLQERMLRRYYCKLVEYRFLAREERRRGRIAQYLLGSTTEGLQILYYRRLKEYARRMQHFKQRQAVARALLSGTERNIRQRYHAMAIHWLRQRQQNDMVKHVVQMLARSRTQLMAHYYYKLVDFNRREQDLKYKHTAVTVMRESHDNSVRQYYLMKALRFLAKKNESKRHEQLSRTLETNRENFLRLKYGRRCRLFLRKAVMAKEAKKQAKLDADIKKVEEMLANADKMTKEEILAETKKTDDDNEALQKEIDELNKQIAAVTDENRELTNRLYAPNASFKRGATDEETLNGIICYLKARSVYCYDDMYAIKQNHTTHGTFTKQRRLGSGFDPKLSTSPHKLFDSGMKLVVVGLDEHCSREKKSNDLYTPELVINMKEELFQDTCAFGLKQMIISWDEYMTLDPSLRKQAPIACKDAIKHQDILLTIALRIYDGRTEKLEEHLQTPDGTPFPLNPARKGGVHKSPRRTPSRSPGTPSSQVNRTPGGNSSFGEEGLPPPAMDAASFNSDKRSKSSRSPANRPTSQPSSARRSGPVPEAAKRASTTRRAPSKTRTRPVNVQEY